MKKKENKKTIAITAIAAGTVALGSLAGANNAVAADLFSFEDLGSGAELRSELLAANNATNFINNNEMELKCGEGDKAKKKDAKASEHKCGEGKCGEGKCGEKKGDKKKAKAESNDKGDKAADKKATKTVKKDE